MKHTTTTKRTIKRLYAVLDKNWRSKHWGVSSLPCGERLPLKKKGGYWETSQRLTDAGLVLREACDDLPAVVIPKSHFHLEEEIVVRTVTETSKIRRI